MCVCVCLCVFVFVCLCVCVCVCVEIGGEKEPASHFDFPPAYGPFRSTISSVTSTFMLYTASSGS